MGWSNLKLMAKAVLDILRHAPGFRVHVHSRCRGAWLGGSSRSDLIRRRNFERKDTPST